jgi:hypothetical protein
MPHDLLDRILAEIRERRDASRAAYDESRQLEAALAALGGPSLDGASVPVSRARRTPSASRRRTRAPRGETRRRVLDAVSERPGASAGEITSASGLDRTIVATTLSRLVKRGELERVELPTGRGGYRVASDGGGSASSGPAGPDEQSTLDADS